MPALHWTLVCHASDASGGDADREFVLHRGERSEEEDWSIGGHLMRVRDAAGRPLPFVRLWSELSIFFMAGMETTAHAITWAL